MDRDLSELIASYYHKGGYFITAGNYAAEICYQKIGTSVRITAPPIITFHKYMCIYSYLVLKSD